MKSELREKIQRRIQRRRKISRKHNEYYTPGVALCSLLTTTTLVDFQTFQPKKCPNGKQYVQGSMHPNNNAARKREKGNEGRWMTASVAFLKIRR